jgi:5-methylcytosine-specific restriction endonuclease McrA
VEVAASDAALSQGAQQSRIASAAGLSAVVAQVATAAVTELVASNFALESLRASCTVLGPGRYKLTMTLNQELFDQLMKLKHLLKHQVPGGNLTAIVSLAIKELLDKLWKQRFAQVSKPRGAARAQGSQNEAPAAQPAASAPQASVIEPRRADKVNSNSRYIPRAVVRAVFARDGAQCTFVSAHGQRCEERGMLELHHVKAFARGGASTVENLKVVCAAYNAFFATQDFGAAHMRAMRTGTRSQSISRATRTNAHD